MTLPDRDGAATPAPASGHPTEPAQSMTRHVRVADTRPFSSRRITPIRHDFDTHPLMQLQRLAQLARDLMPTRQCRFIRSGSTRASEFWHDPESPDGRQVDEVFARIEEPGSWIALYNVETDAAYRAFLDEVVDAMRPLVEPEHPDIFGISGFVFVSAPPSVTPFHIDRENNIWLQIRGRKSMHAWDHRDRRAVSGTAVENFIVSRDLSRVRLDDAVMARARTFEVGPGDGVYWPATTPHMTTTRTDWATPGDGVSISIGVCFYSASTRREARVHQFNRVLRRLRLAPTSPGESAWRDAIKAPLGRAFATLATRLCGYDAPPGAY